MLRINSMMIITMGMRERKMRWSQIKIQYVKQVEWKQSDYISAEVEAEFQSLPLGICHHWLWINVCMVPHLLCRVAILKYKAFNGSKNGGVETGGHVCTKFKLLFSLALAKTQEIFKVSFATCFGPYTGVRHISAPHGHSHKQVSCDFWYIR